MTSCFREITVSIKAAGAWHAAGSCAGSPHAPSAAYVMSSRRKAPVTAIQIRRADGSPFRPEEVKVSVSIPLLNFGHAVVPDCGRHYVNASKALDIRAPLYRLSGANAGHPFFAVADEAGDFLAALGIASPTGDTEIRRVLPRISQRKAMVGGDHHLRIDIAWTHRGGIVEELPLALYLREKATSWVHALREYADAVKARERVAYPLHPDAWLPTWCTWTAACSCRMNESRVLVNAQLARDLGIGTVILDDGWFGVGLDNDHGVLNVGDYAPDPARFPDLPGLVGRIHDLGLKVLLWHAPLCVAPTSRAYGRLRRLLVRHGRREFASVNGLAMLCPASPEVRRYVADETVRLMRAYGVDGLKSDLYNCLPADPCDSTAHSHDVAGGVESVEAAMATQWEAARSVRPDALLELKQDYGSVRLARYGTMVRAGDTAYDVDTNCRRCFYTQAYAPCVHNDYFVTSDLAGPRAIALAMIRMLAAGVPTFGNDLTTMPGPLRQVVRTWLGFYRDHLDLFRLPREPQTNDLSAWQGGSAGCRWVAALWQCREVRLPAARRVLLLNGTGRGDLYLRQDRPRRVWVATRSPAGKPLARIRLRLTDGMRLQIPSGGLAEIAG